VFGEPIGSYQPDPDPGPGTSVVGHELAASILDGAVPTGVGPGDVTLLEDLPLLRLEMHEDSDDVTMTITLPADDLPAVVAAAREVAADPPADQGRPGAGVIGVVVRAPGGIRTHTGRCLRALSLPVGLQGRRGGTAARRA
jgi:hypothetical protein